MRRQVCLTVPTDEQNELLNKTLFDLSAVGAVRFHHRSSQEYLAAKRLLRIHNKGMPISGTTLRVTIHNQNGLSTIMQRPCKVSADGGFAATTFRTQNGNYAHICITCIFTQRCN